MSARSGRWQRLFAILCSLTSLTTIANAAVAERAGPVPANPTVTLPNGIVVGTATRAHNQPTETAHVNAYLGVPYALSPPVRFLPPEPAKKWGKIIAQKNKPGCLAQWSGTARQRRLSKLLFDNPGGFPENLPESEDCLYVNVFASPKASKKSLKPVLLWFLAGDLRFGSAAVGYYNASTLAITQDVVVVTFNFRNTIFGFSSAPELAANKTQNTGFLDQRFALRWVSQNIKYFGGDPSKVTLFGVSSGAGSIKQILANPERPLQFHAAIVESSPSVPISNDTSMFLNVTDHFHCTNAPSQLECLRKLPAAAIQKYVTGLNMDFFPIQDDKTLFYNVSTSVETKQFADVPLLMGTTVDESTSIIAATGITSGKVLIDDIAKGFGLSGAELAALEALYIPVVGNNTYQIALRILTDTYFTCPTSSLTQYFASSGIPVWRYWWDAWHPNVMYLPDLRAYHSVEISYVFGSYALENHWGKVQPNQIALSKYMMKTWADFARNPSAGPGWPGVGKNFGFELGVIGQNRSTGEVTQANEVADYPCDLLNVLSTGLGNAY